MLWVWCRDPALFAIICFASVAAHADRLLAWGTCMLHMQSCRLTIVHKMYMLASTTTQIDHSVRLEACSSH